MAGRYALIIACTHYSDHRLRDLPKTEADAKGMRAVLADPGICNFPAENITWCVNKPESDVRLAIERLFKNRHKDDLLLFYFAGHGLVDDYRRLVLALNGTNPDYRSTGIDAGFLREEMENSKSRRQLVILDACNSGAFANVRDAIGSPAGIKEALKGEGRIVLTASDKLQFSFDSISGVDKLQNGIFTHYIIQGLREFKAVAADGETITVNSLYEYARNEVENATERKQTPTQIVLDRRIGDLTLAVKPATPLPQELQSLIKNKDHDYRTIGVRKIATAIANDAPYTKAGKAALEKLYQSERDFEIRRELEKALGKASTQRPKERTAQQAVTTKKQQKAKWLPTLAITIGLPLLAVGLVWKKIFPPDTTTTPQMNQLATENTAQLSDTATNSNRDANPKSQVAASTNSKPVMTSPGTVFHDKLKSGGEGPAMVVIPAGSFQMGSTKKTDGDERDDDETQHTVKIASFSLGQNEVTIGEFKQFVEKTDYKTTAESTGEGCYGWDSSKNTWAKDKKYSWKNVGFTQTDQHPVVCVSWKDSVAYTKWISEQTSESYRLPTEAEWEYAARAGSKTRRYWGDDLNHKRACGYANVADKQAKKTLAFGSTHPCDDGYVYTAPVAQFSANEYQLNDMLGNAWEWTCSKYEESYAGEEKRCIANENDSALRALRGGSWNIGPQRVRSADRFRNKPSGRSNVIGFRLARTN